MSDNRLFEEAAKLYLAVPTKKLGREKGANAHSSLEWMSRKRPLLILVEGMKRPVAYGAKTRLLKHKVISMDDTSGIFEGREMGDISNLDITKMMARLRNGKGIENAAINSYLTYLKSLCNYSNDRLEVTFWKFPKIERLPTEGRDYFLPPNVAKGWMGFLDPLWKDLVRMGLATALRKSYIVLLRWAQVYKALTRLHISGSDLKNGSEHNVELNELATEVLKDRLADKNRLKAKYPRLSLEYVFVQEDRFHLSQPMTLTSVIKDKWTASIRMYNTYIKGSLGDEKLLIPEGKLLVHTLRQSFATWLKNAGADLKDIRMVGSWKSLASVQRYVQDDRKRAREISSKIVGRY
jgi:integrase